MRNWQNFRDDMLYYSRAWESFLGALMALVVMLGDWLLHGPMALLFFGWIVLLALIWGFVQLRKGRKYRLSHPDCPREEKVRELKDRLFYDQAKKYFICSGIFLALILWVLLENVFSHSWSASGALFIAGYYFLDSLIKGCLSVRYERQQHREFLSRHPEYREKQ